MSAPLNCVQQTGALSSFCHVCSMLPWVQVKSNPIPMYASNETLLPFTGVTS